MPQQSTYSRMDLIKAFRAENPDAAHIPDNDIFRAIAVEDPDLAKGAVEFQQVAAKPEKPPSQGFPMALGEAGKRYAQAGVPGLLFGAGTAEPSTMSDQAMELLKGAYEGTVGAITGLPDMIRSLAPVARTVMGGMGRGPLAPEDIQDTATIGKGMAQGMHEPVTVPARGGAALLAPEKFEAPSDEEFKRSARGTGAILGGTALGRAAAPAVGKLNKYIDEAPVRKGYTTINPETLKPELPAKPIRVETGRGVPKVEPGTLLEFDDYVKTAAKALGGDTSLEIGDSMRRAFAEAFPDLKHAQQQNKFLRGAIDSPQKFRGAVQWARNRVWREGMEPAFKAAGEVDLTPVADQLISEIPESIRTLRPKQALALEKTFSKLFDGKVVKAETLHEFAKEARAKIQSKLAKNAFDRQAAFGTPDGKMAESFNTALRDRLYQHVQDRTGVDIRPTAERYGALSELEQTALGLSEPQSFLEKLFTSYTFPTQRAVAARVGERIGQHMISDMKQLERAFNKYSEVFKNPSEQAKVTQPFRLRAVAPRPAPRP